MAIQTLNGPILFCPLFAQPSFPDTNVTTATMDAAGESIFVVGHIRLSTGPGTSKTLDTNGKIHWRSGAVTFANASSNLRVGVQDVSAAGVNDDVWTGEPQADLVGGTDTIAATAVITTTIESGSRSITHGDQLCIGAELTTRGGADSIVVNRINPDLSGTESHSALDTGSGPALATQYAPFVIEFGDGTLGWMEPYIYPVVYEASAAFNSGSTPDEYALVFQTPFPFQAGGLFAQLSGLAAADDFELILYSDPLGTPVAERTLSFDMSLYAVGGGVTRTFTSAFSIVANTNYAVALRPTTANSLNFQQCNFGSNGANIRKATPLGTNWSMYSRSNQTGAFGSQSTTILPAFGVWATGFDDGASVHVNVQSPIVGTRYGMVGY